jgi:pSer/pThr/pTyr-binding forkhead associated (FHA) protein
MVKGARWSGALQIGRGEDNDLVLLDDHISRRHARLETHAGVVWLRDLESANGSFVNGEPVAGACRLFHGDEVRFDTLAFQLVGRGADLTPVRRDGETDNGAMTPARLTPVAGSGSTPPSLPLWKRIRSWRRRHCPSMRAAPFCSASASRWRI